MTRTGLMLRSSAMYFGIVFSIGFILGAFRVPFLVPRMGERAAELVEMPLMFIAIFLAAGYIVKNYSSLVSSKRWIMVGIISLSLLLGAELLLAVVLTGRGFTEYIANRDPVSGSVYLGMLLLFAAMPWLRHRIGSTH